MNRPAYHQNFKWPHTGAIFCGGNSSRMGSPKAGIVLHNGLTMIEHVYNVLKQVCKDVVLVGHCQGVPPSLKNVVQIKDKIKNKGPMGGLDALLCSGMDSEYLISPCDIGLVNSELFELLIEEHIKPPAILAYPEYDLSISSGGNPMVEIVDQPLIGRYSANLFGLVQKQISRNELAMHRLIKLTDATKVIVPGYLRKVIKDMDSPVDLNILFHPN